MRIRTDTKTGDEHFDIFIIGGGINGAGIARDAAGRGFSVCLCEAGDFASGTSSASTKLFHGGLRYLEYFEFRLVREALMEREILLRAMPHISRPMRFVLPYHKDMRFDGETPASRLISVFMPWLKGRRPAWMIRLGLFLYDHMGGRKTLSGTTALDLTKDIAGKSLKSKFKKAYEYSDCWVEDSRLVILNLQDAESGGAKINDRTTVRNAEYRNGKWNISIEDNVTGTGHFVSASIVVNASGPWVDEVLKTVFKRNDANNIRLVRGSHIVIRKKYDHDRCYFFQNADSRIIFAIPYEDDYTLIGTTDVDHGSAMIKPVITESETRYLCNMASDYFAEPVTQKDIVWTYSGVRPLYNDGASLSQEATRDYIIRTDESIGDGTLLNIFGGKITTYRKLAESMLAQVEAKLGKRGDGWTADASLPGGNFNANDFPSLVKGFVKRYPYISDTLMKRLFRQYGTKLETILADVNSKKELGKHFGQGLYEFEVRYLHKHEWAKDADDFLFRRTKLGVKMSRSEQARFRLWLTDKFGRC